MSDRQNERDAIASWMFQKSYASVATENERLRVLLLAASKYIADAGSDEDPETQQQSCVLLDDIRRAIAGPREHNILTLQGAGQEQAKRLAQKILGECCVCYADAWPAETCIQERDRAAALIMSEKPHHSSDDPISSNGRLQALLLEASQYVVDAGSDEDSETQHHSQKLLAEIRAAILRTVTHVK